MQCFSFCVCASFEVETQRGIKRQMFRDEPSVSEMFTFCSLVVCVIRRIIEVTHLEVRVREWRVSLMLFCADYFTFFNAFPQCVSVGFIMLQERSRSFPRSIIQGSVSHRQSLKFHRKQFGGWVICKARWVHTVVPYLCFTALASCFSCQQSALSPGFVLTRGNFVESYTVTESQVILSEEMFWHPAAVR